MDISSLTNRANDTVGIEALKKAQSVEQNQVSKLLEGMQEQSKDMQQQVAQSTGVGANIDLMA